MTMRTAVEATYCTSDLALAAAVSLWLPVDSLDRGNPRQAIFNFSRCAELDKLVELYWRAELQVEPQAYFNQLRILKARLYGRG